jgi:hypothetical protein
VSLAKYELDFYIPEDGILHSDRRENLKSCRSVENASALHRFVFAALLERRVPVQYDKCCGRSLPRGAFRPCAGVRRTAPDILVCEEVPEITLLVVKLRTCVELCLHLPYPDLCSPEQALGFTQPLTEMSTRSIKIMFLGSKAAAGA